MAKNYTRKTHIERDETGKPLCGAHLVDGVEFVSEDHATCKNCTAVKIAESRMKTEFPWIEVRKDKVILHKSPADNYTDDVREQTDTDIIALSYFIVDKVNE